MNGQLHTSGRFTPKKRAPPPYPLSRMLSGHHGRCERGSEETNTRPCRESNPGTPARSLVTILTELPWL